MICGVRLVASRDRARRWWAGQRSASGKNPWSGTGPSGISWSSAVSSSVHAAMQDITRTTKRSGTGTAWNEISDISHPLSTESGPILNRSDRPIPPNRNVAGS